MSGPARDDRIDPDDCVDGKCAEKWCARCRPDLWERGEHYWPGSSKWTQAEFDAWAAVHYWPNRLSTHPAQNVTT